MSVPEFLKNKGRNILALGILGLGVLTPSSTDALISGGCWCNNLAKKTIYDTCLITDSASEPVMDDQGLYSGIHDYLFKESVPRNHFEYDCSYEVR